MRVPEVQTSCCGCSLETGTIVIACLNAVSSLFMIFGYLQQLTQPFYTTDDFEMKEYFAIYRTISLLLLLFSIFGFVIAILLIIGVKKRIEIFFNIWLFFSSYNMISSIIPIFTLIIFFFYSSMADVAGIILFIYILSIALGIYLLMIVNSCKLLVMNREVNSHEI